MVSSTGGRLLLLLTVSTHTSSFSGADVFASPVGQVSVVVVSRGVGLLACRRSGAGVEGMDDVSAFTTLFFTSSGKMFLSSSIFSRVQGICQHFRLADQRRPDMALIWLVFSWFQGRVMPILDSPRCSIFSMRTVFTGNRVLGFYG